MTHNSVTLEKMSDYQMTVEDCENQLKQEFSQNCNMEQFIPFNAF